MDTQSNNADDLKFLSSADAWLRDMGYMSDFHKNELILNTLLIASRANDVELDIDLNNFNIKVVLLYSRFQLFLTRKNKLNDDLMFYYKKKFPKFSFNIDFKIG